MTVLRIPPLLAGAVTLLGAALVGAAAAGALSEEPKVLYVVLNGLIGAALLPVGVAWAAMRVQLDDDGLQVRSVRQRRSWSWEQVRGVKLDQGEGRPRLSIHPRDGAAVGVPAWSLRARHEDGEVEPAREALTRICGARGVAFRSRALLDASRRGSDVAKGS